VDTSDNPRRATSTNRKVFDLFWVLKRRHDNVGAALMRSFPEQPSGAMIVVTLFTSALIILSLAMPYLYF